MAHSLNPIEVVRNLTVEQVNGRAGKLEIAVKNNTPGSNIKRLVFTGDSPIVTGSRINAYVSREGNYGAGTGDISDFQSGESHSTEQSTQNSQGEAKALCIEILGENGKVLRTDYDNDYKPD